MAHQVKIPAAGESISSATVGQWHKASGESVKQGEVLATIETDKVSSELEAEVGGILKILVPEGEEVAIGTVIAEIADSTEAAGTAGAEEPGNPRKTARKPKAMAAAKAKSAARKVARKAPAPAAGSEVGKEGEDPAVPKVLEIRVPAAGESITSATIAQWHKRDGERVAAGETIVTLETDKVSAEMTAEGGGILRIVAPEGREVAIGALIGTIAIGAETPSAEPAAAAAPAEPAAPRAAEPTIAVPVAARPEVAGGVVPDPARLAKLIPNPAVRPVEAPRGPAPAVKSTDGRTTRRRMSTLRRKIAAQLVQAQHTAAILTTFNEADLSAVMKLRKAVQEDFVSKYGVKLGFMSFFVKAAVQALKEAPAVNARVDGDEIVQNHFYDIGIAVGTEKGLIVPVVRDADQKGFADIERDILEYAQKARDGKIQLEDLQGGSFTISNGGIYGSLLSTPILNPPQSGILGMHTIQERPVAVDGQVVIRPMMYLALSYDHRLVDGKEAVTFLIRIKDCIENPTRLLLEV